MKIAVCGSGSEEDKSIAQKAKEIGSEITKSNNTLITGGCHGYPYAALRGTILENGKSICYSPAKDKEEHISKYNFPFENSSEYIFTGKGIPGRNIPLIQAADAVIFLDGKIGTLNEFTLALHFNKKIAVLDLGNLPKLLPKIAEVCDKTGESERIIYDTDTKSLIKKIIH